ncbi:MAG: methionine ABC transporter ATP-binding protein [Planctomycetota bacterium]|jgi:D-methionine transport system ATP-binding protein|nr:methionine ABC transporter ATP-binding protein [Planctomycetota bacterium]
MISISGLYKYFGGQRVLEDIHMRVAPGEIYGIVGHSGAGKSTLLRCLNGLEPYQDGSVKVTGEEVGDLSPSGLLALRRKMGMIFQTFNLMSRKNVFKNVAFPLEIWKTPKAEVEDRAMELLDLVGLADRRNDRVQNLSGGQKQRVGIARALALRPGILLCDEATSALDPKTTGSILDLLEDINKRLGLTIVIVTHQMEVVKRLCHKMLLLDGGVTMAEGATEDLFLSLPANLRKFIDEEYTLIPNGVNIRLMFPRDISQDAVITTMARELDIGFSIVGGKLERYLDDVFGFLIINVRPELLDRVMDYMREKRLYWQILDADGDSVHDHDESADRIMNRSRR